MWFVIIPYELIVIACSDWYRIRPTVCTCSNTRSSAAAYRQQSCHRRISWVIISCNLKLWTPKPHVNIILKTTRPTQNKPKMNPPFFGRDEPRAEDLLQSNNTSWTYNWFWSVTMFREPLRDQMNNTLQHPVQRPINKFDGCTDMAHLCSVFWLHLGFINGTSSKFPFNKRLPSLKLTAKAHSNYHLSWFSYHQNGWIFQPATLV